MIFFLGGAVGRAGRASEVMQSATRPIDWSRPVVPTRMPNLPRRDELIYFQNLYSKEWYTFTCLYVVSLLLSFSLSVSSNVDVTDPPAHYITRTLSLSFH